MLYDLEKEDLISIIKNSDYGDLEALAREIRDFLVEKVSKTGGHLASNLGIVETTIALHKVYDTAVDRVIFDVGHQSYVHKIITGRAGAFDTLRKYKGLSGFPKSRESIHDAYDTGHSSTSISAAMGYATARDLRNEDYQVVAVIGDGAMTGGLVYEALNNIGASGTNIKIVLNDNGMSIAKNVGAMSRHLNNLRTSKNYTRMKKNIRGALDNIPVVGQRVSDTISHTKNKIKYSLLDEQGVLFEDLGIKYIGPVDGYNLQALVEAYTAANQYDGPTLVHVITKKGKGYYWSEKYPRKFHGIAPFDADNGNILSSPSGPSYSKVFGDKLVELARTDESIVAISAAMGTATGLGPFYKEFEPRFFDVGIAEAHAVVFAAGMAKAGMTPVVAIYSSFLQRAFDQLIEDICLQNLHVVFAVDRAGLVGADGETHHGMFDLSYLNMIPNMKILCPADGNQLEEMLEYGVHQYDGPIAIRYPRGSSQGNHLRLKPFTGENTVLSVGKDVTILAVGAMLDTGIEAARLLREHGFDAGVTAINVVKPMDAAAVNSETKLVVTLEDNTIIGGFSDEFDRVNREKAFGILNFALPDQFIEQGSIPELREECAMTPEDVVKGVEDYFEKRKA
ncbi:1-deoxy-D-xylulose-5-phosphate synthase [Mogibacterium kristiansenii]|uniref:1-deoxy-D-xylulose-5-phosphate synthase n=1 Tax=Mogibacterium kristiansenii TaxID=2606708 RepID=A0A6N7XIY3_9FIRM|nr:1-deoxy-D-xylulose-5-phosphate synthase [Mogibacterium kristiansenii]MST70015.1 1-deoxy-D-xylulose-5-phosphate synthase [Mogibacterium kristiansenii]